MPGNNFATVVAGDNVQFTMTQVTRGSIDMARKGRLCLPDAAADQSQGAGAFRSSSFTSRFRSGSSAVSAVVKPRP